MCRRGFTLIELVVVLLILAIVLAMIGLTLVKDASAELRDEADRLALLLQAAQDEAVMQGRIYAASFTKDGYEFLVLDDEEKLAPLTADDLLRPRELANDVRVGSVVIDGVTADSPATVIFDPSGMASDFTVTLVKDTMHWLVRGFANGQVRSIDPAKADAAPA